MRGLPTGPIAIRYAHVPFHSTTLLPNPLQGLIEGNDICYSFKGKKS